MSSSLDTSARCWNDFFERFSESDSRLYWWQAGPEMTQHINRKITQDPDANWIEYTISKYFKDENHSNCLILGCGDGWLEQSLARQGSFQHFDAYDIADKRVNLARIVAEKEGLDISYYVADVNKLKLPPDQYDAVWVTQAMHHFEDLESVLSEVSKALKPTGHLVLNEYVGPNRFQFSKRQKELVNHCLNLLPNHYRIISPELVNIQVQRDSLNRGAAWNLSRVMNKIKDHSFLEAVRRRLILYRSRAKQSEIIKETVDFPTVHSLMANDPSEAVRSQDIVATVEKYFEIVEKKDWGGNISQFLFEGIVDNFSEKDPLSQNLIKMLLDIEDTLIECGEIESDFTYIVARPG